MYNKIKDSVLFIIEELNGAWQYYHYYYIVTVKGDVYKCKGDSEFKIANTSKPELDQFVKTIDENSIYSITHIELKIIKEMALKCKNIEPYSKGYTQGVAFDAGDIKYYAFNENVTEVPIVIGMRGNIDVHSENQCEEDISIWLDAVVRGINEKEFLLQHKK